MGRFARWRQVVRAQGDLLRGGLRRAEEEPAETGPAPSLNRLDALVEGFAAGQPVRWSLAGQPRPLPSVVDVVAYRIIEVALTNAHQHAPGAAVAVRLRYDAKGITIEVRDAGGPPGTAPPSGVGPAAPPGGAGTPGAGRGLIQVRRRAEKLGGTFSAGPRAEGGFTVRALLPAPEDVAE
ncbi:ATP-binding protein [Micromonospora sp. CPCC 205539]|uniref:sensor histidine kinase n=1 Tax=Micromonospora sp. CPCC 205539 TaxID=3122408 RepID=UPI002FF22A5D